jgi:hypothetical protein
MMQFVFVGRMMQSTAIIVIYVGFDGLSSAKANFINVLTSFVIVGINASLLLTNIVQQSKDC